MFICSQQILEKAENIDKNVPLNEKYQLGKISKDALQKEYEDDKANKLKSNKNDNVNKNFNVQSNKIITKTNYSPINENNYYESGSEGFESC